MKNETKLEFPGVYASPTQSRFASCALFTTEDSYNPFDATAPGMNPEIALARAKYAATAINSHADLLAALKASLEEMDAFQAYWTSPKMGLKRGTSRAQELARAAIARAEGRGECSGQDRESYSAQDPSESHGPTWAQRVHTAAECDCFKSSQIAE